jgi:hypothetical protein
MALGALARISLTEFAKASFVIRALNTSFFWMCVQALISSRAVAILCKPPTLRHTPQIVLVKKFACISLLTEATQPMFANSRQPFSLTRMCGQLFWRLKV